MAPGRTGGRCGDGAESAGDEGWGARDAARRAKRVVEDIVR